MPQDYKVTTESIVNAGSFSSDKGNITTDGASGNLTVGGTSTLTGNISAAGNITWTANNKILIGTKAGGGTQNLFLLDTNNDTQIQAVSGKNVKIGDGTNNFINASNTALTSSVAFSTNNFKDKNNNQVNSGGAIITAAVSGAIAHNYAGTLTPTCIWTMLTVAGTVIWGTIGTANATITMSAAGTFTAQALLV